MEPVIRQLTKHFNLAEAFDRMSAMPGCLWLDSASRGPIDATDRPIGGYSFLTADPIDQLVASIGDCNPWSTLDQWYQRLPERNHEHLPPFQGGIAGLIGYEAATWLEPVGTARSHDLPTAAVSLGLYDWTIATDHQTGESWLISQGFCEEDQTESQRRERAEHRADEVEAMLADPPEAELIEPLRDRMLVSTAQYPTKHSGVTSNFRGADFRDAVAEIVKRIHAGDSFQVNLAQRLLAPAECASAELYDRLRVANPAPFGAFYRADGFEVLSSSPEGFLRVRDRTVQTRPIKGTVHRTGNVSDDRALAETLMQSEKDRAENIMIVDLMRNDLSRVCTDESVEVTQLCEVEQYEFVQHLVSVVEGELADNKTIIDLLRSCFPGGSVTGAPKIEAMRTIASLEPNPRGPYCGSIGYISSASDADFNILIRTITATGGYWQIPVGGGITAKSDPAAEESETWAKAEGMLRALQA